MMKLLSPQLLAAAAVACIAAFGAPSAFAQGTFTPGSGTTANCNTGGLTVDTKQCSQGSVVVDMTAYGFTNTLGTTALAGFQAGRMGDFDALGIGAYTGSNENSTNANHAFDNLTANCGTGSGANGGTNVLSTANTGCGGSIEGLLLNFGTSKVNLSQVGIGFNGGSADLSVWAYTGNNLNMATQTASGSTTANGTTAAAMAGWTLVSNHDYGSTLTGTQNTSGTIYSSYFMITTYFGAGTSTLAAGNDQFKINSFTVNTCSGTLSGGSTGGTCTANNGNGATCSGGSAPEPGSLALVGVALIGITASRRRLFGRR